MKKKNHLSDERGVTRIEYLLILMGVTLAVIAILFTFSDQLRATFYPEQAASAETPEQQAD